jgi:hypothetical protein
MVTAMTDCADLVFLSTLTAATAGAAGCGVRRVLLITTLHRNPQSAPTRCRQRDRFEVVDGGAIEPGRLSVSVTTRLQGFARHTPDPRPVRELS